MTYLVVYLKVAHIIQPYRGAGSTVPHNQTLLSTSRSVPFFHVIPYYKNCPSANCVSVADSDCIYLGVVRRQNIALIFGAALNLISYRVLINL